MTSDTYKFTFYNNFYFDLFQDLYPDLNYEWKKELDSFIKEERHLLSMSARIRRQIFECECKSLSPTEYNKLLQLQNNLNEVEDKLFQISDRINYLPQEAMINRI